jgi:hypothetical protein
MAAFGLLGMLMAVWPVLLLGGAAWFLFGRKKSTDDTTHKLKSGLGHIRQRTIAVGDTVIAVNNIGSIVIMRGAKSYAMSIVGAILILAALVMIGGSDKTMPLVMGFIGAILIVINLAQQPDHGLSIGTCDGRETMIVSTDESFLGDMLDFIRRKVDTGDIKLQGRFDIGASHFNTEGGGVVIGDQGVAHGALRPPET